MGKVFPKSNGGGWFGVKHQAPFPKIEVFTSSDNTTPKDNKNASIIFEAEAKGGNTSHSLLSYSFSEGVDDLEGSFSFTVEDENTDINSRKSIFDAIPIRSIVKIYEGDSQPVFIGVVKRRNISSSMTAQGPRRSIQFSGKSIISLISAYTVTTDLRICYVDPEIESNQMTADLSMKSMNIKEFMAKTWEYYLKQGEDNTGAVVNRLIRDEIQLWIIGAEGKTLADSIETGQSEKFHYPIVGQFFREGNNTITQIWRNVLASPVYELSAVCRSGKPKIVARESPFSEADWKSLDMYEIDPLDLISYDMSQSDEEVYNAFMGYLEGSVFAPDYYTKLGAAQQDSVLEKIPEKIDIYGFKPLQVSFRGFDRQDMTQANIEEIRRKLNRKTKYWYGRLDEMYTGTITLLTDFTEQGSRNPKAGCKAKFLGGEFYIMRSDHKWNYGSAPTNTLTVTRGLQYSTSGAQGAELVGIGGRFKELG